ncbi:MAG: Y-family DNA polymerase [Bacteroidetes bacterium]|nr:Y-family DNA polymerase [Bacteroidota bacterium]
MYAIVDCNSFYCGCERLFRPDISKKPVVVLSNNDGCIISRTDEAKLLGIDMAVPYYQNKELIEKNKVSVFSSNYNLYGDLSARIMATLSQVAGKENVEVYSVDEAFIDLHQVPEKDLQKMAERLKETVEMWTGIMVSVGVAPTKVLSKVANHFSKKNKVSTAGIMVLDTPEKIHSVLQATGIESIWGIGRRYALKLHAVFGLENAAELSRMPPEWARKNLGGIVGVRLLAELNGQSCIYLKNPLEKKKRIATTRMFGRPVSDIKEIREAVATYITRAAEKLRRQRSAATIIEVFVMTNAYVNTEYEYNPASYYRSRQLPQPSASTPELIHHAVQLAEELHRPSTRYLKAGVLLSGIVPDNSIQANLFLPPVPAQKQLMEAIDNINFSMRNDMIKYASAGLHKHWKMRQELRSPRYTTRWEELPFTR